MAERAAPPPAAGRAGAPQDRIVIRGAAEHNLKRIDLEIPRNRLVVITGLSGSGKSSLAFDTIYAEGQRRYVESLSAYARQFLEQMEKPNVELIEGLSPAISIEQRTTARNPRSTVGTVTEIYDYLRLLFARVGRPHCHLCGREIASQTVQQIADRLLALPRGAKLQILAPIVRGRKGEYRKELDSAQRRGFVRVRIDGQIYDLGRAPKLDKRCKHNIEIVVDRLAARADDALRNRLTDSLETALRLGEGLVLALVQREGEAAPEEILFSERLACIQCGTSMPEMSPRAFSFNSPYGACPECDGLGERRELDERKLIPDASKSLAEGALAASGWSGSWFLTMLKALDRTTEIDPRRPWAKLPPAARRLILHGSGDREYEFEYASERNRYTFRRPFEGVIPHLARRYKETHSAKVREEIEQFMALHPCPACRGRRLRPESLAVKVDGRRIDEFTAMAVTEAAAAFRALALGPREEEIARPILKEIRERVGFLVDVGLGYLTLDRSAATLSGGEGQRIRLATQIGSRLTGVLYVLDEPSIGLHQRDNRRLLDALEAMRDLGNSVLVVEHDEETIRTADWVIDLGPGAGEEGGRVVVAGTPEQVERCPESLTGRYLAGDLRIEIPERRRRPRPGQFLTVEGAAEHNLKNLRARFPLGVLTVVAGVSGSGKSTLVNEILYRALARKLYRAGDLPGEHRGIEGAERIDKVVEIDQSPIGRTPRSNPATYTGTFAFIRDLFSRVPESRARGYGAGRYSFNVKGGRCEACEGDGVIKIEMHFLPDVYVTCEVCGGRRYNRETLEILYKGKSIADVLAMSVAEALRFFENVPYIRRKLETLDAVGLSYVRLGQAATTLSGGEAQRVKLSKELSRRSTGRTVYFLDEPTTGLHFDDIKKLLRVLDRLVEEGNTVIVIEHNLDVIKTADHLIDLGPEGGEAGGRIVAEGTPEEVAAVEASYTGQHLRRVLAGARR
jgi:excinuclease ABC subunit A